jgi:zinc-binding alcohol dehydrogenase/oxidoreductase
MVAVQAAALNRRDWWIWRRPTTPMPVTLGSDGAGRVVAVGHGVDQALLGEAVVIYPTFGWPRGAPVPDASFEILGSPRPGTFAERIVVPVENVVRKPARLSWEEAAALNLAGLTAWRAVVTCARVRPGDRVLVAGAGSGVATFAVQIAAALGAEVWVTTSSAAKLNRLVELGARGGVLYRDDGWPEQLSERSGGAMDAAIDSWGAEGWQRILPTLRWGGVLVNYGDTGGETATVGVSDVYWAWRSILGTTMGSPDEFDALLAHVDATDWGPAIDSVFPLDALGSAAARLTASDRFGKVVLTMGDIA